MKMGNNAMSTYLVVAFSMSFHWLNCKYVISVLLYIVDKRWMRKPIHAHTTENSIHVYVFDLKRINIEHSSVVLYFWGKLNTCYFKHGTILCIEHAYSTHIAFDKLCHQRHCQHARYGCPAFPYSSISNNSRKIKISPPIELWLYWGVVRQSCIIIAELELK